MYCSRCGNVITDGARFCSACGAPVVSAVTGTIPGAARRLVRPRQGRMIAGVCAGLALQYGWDLTLVRVLTVVAAVFTSGIVLLVYLAAWVVIPEAPYELPSPGVGI